MFTPIDITKWPRGEMFYYFSKMAPTGYSMTVEVDVTRLYATVKEKGIRFFPAYIWLVTKNLNRQIEFKCAEKDGVLGYFDILTPLYAGFHDDTKTISLMWAEYSDDFDEFYERYLENERKYGDNHRIIANEELPPENAYTVSCVPWVNFKHFAVHSYENRPYYFPSIEAGRFTEKDGRLMMPLSLTCHHATTDGYHIDIFLRNLQQDMDDFT